MDVLTLEAPLEWWPSSSTIQSQPFTQLEAALAWLTTSHRWESSRKPQKTGIRLAAGLSRLGATLILDGNLAQDEKGQKVFELDAAPVLPMQLRVLEALGGANEEGLDVDDDTRITIVGMPITAIPPPHPTSSSILRSMRKAVFIPSHLSTPLDGLLQRSLRALVSRRSAEASRHCFSSTLIQGAAGSGKSALASALMAAIPDHLPCLDDDGTSRTITVEKRMVKCERIFDDTSSEAAAAMQLRRYFRTSWTPPSSRVTDGTFDAEGELVHEGAGVRNSRALLLILDDVDAICPADEVDNVFVLAAMHELATILDSFHGTGAGIVTAGAFDSVVILSTATEQLHPTFTSGQRLSGDTLRLGVFTTAERIAALTWLSQGEKNGGRTLTEGAALEAAVRDAKGVSFADIQECCRAATVSDAKAFLTRRAAIAAQLMTTDAAPGGTQGGEMAGPMPQGLSQLVGIDAQVKTLRQRLLQPFARQGALRALGFDMPKGALIVGPSGSGKTALLAALMEEFTMAAKKTSEGSEGSGLSVRGVKPNLNVMMVDCHTLLTKEVGMSEKRISRVFQHARAMGPCVLLMDNFDVLAPPRHRETGESSGSAQDRTLSTLLMEMDGVREQSSTVVVIAAAPSTSDLDPAAIRPGRLDVHISLELPTPQVQETFATGLLKSLEAKEEADGWAANVGGAFNSTRTDSVRTFADVRDIVRDVVLRLHDSHGDAMNEGRGVPSGDVSAAITAAMKKALVLD